MTEIGKRLGAHARVAGVLAQAAEAAKESRLRSDILMQVAELSETMLGDLRARRGGLQVGARHRPQRSRARVPARQALERLYSASGNHAALADILGIEVALEENVETPPRALASLGELVENGARRSRARHRGVATAPRGRARRRARADRARAPLRADRRPIASWCVTLRAREQGATSPDVRRPIMIKIAETLADKLDDKPEAILAFRAVLEEFGPERKTLTALERLYEATER